MAERDYEVLQRHGAAVAKTENTARVHSNDLVERIEDEERDA